MIIIITIRIILKRLLFIQCKWRTCRCPVWAVHMYGLSVKAKHKLSAWKIETERNVC